VNQSDVDESPIGGEPEERLEPPVRPWYAKQAKKLWWRVHATFPNILPSPYGDEAAFFAEKDERENEKTRVPLNEELRLQAMWGAELFGPGEVELLYTQMGKLGWDTDRFGTEHRNVVKWIREARTYGSEGSFNLGVVGRNSEKNFLRDYMAPVPDEVDYLLVYIKQITASITCVLTGFVLKPEYAQYYEQQLLRDRKTSHRPLWGRFSYQTWGVEHLKRESIDKGRALYRDIVVRWFQKNLPGYFCSVSEGKRLPTAELITCSQEIPLTQYRSGDPSSEWAELLIPFGWADVWTSTECNEFRLRLSDLSGETPFHAIATIRPPDIPEEAIRHHGGKSSRGAVVAFAHERLEGIFCHNAALTLLLEISRSLKHSRERLRSTMMRHSRILPSIESIKHFFDQSLGTPAMVSELHKKSDHVHEYEWDCHEFINLPWRDEDAPVKMAEILRTNTRGLSERVLLDEETTREHFQQIATIVSTRESVKAQRRMEFLTVVAVILALASLLLSLAPKS
jgi:hypothetical protein